MPDQVEINSAQFIELFSANNDLPIEDKIITDHLRLENFKIWNNTKKISNCRFTGNIAFSGIKSGNNLLINDCSFNGNISFLGHNFHEVDIANSTVSGDILIDAGNATSKYYFQGCTANGKVEFKNCSHYSVDIRSTSQKKSVFNEEISFHGLDVNSIIIRDVVINKDINFYCNQIHQIFIANGEYAGIKFHKRNYECDIKIHGDNENRELLKVGTIYSYFLINKGSFIIQNAEVQNLDFEGLDNQKIFKIQNVSFKDKVILTDGDLGKLHFNQIYFDEKCKVSFDNSFLGDCIFSNIVWTNKYVLKTFAEIKDEKNINKQKNALILREVYRQLKNVNKSQSNNIDALGFYRNEMDTYYRYLSKENGRHGDKFILWVSKYSNDFGQNWIRPIIWIFLFSFIFYFLIGLSISDCCYCFFRFTYSFGKFFLFIIPTHSIDNIDPKIFESSLALFLDFSARIFSSFFIFQTVYAFRKYIR